jgi:uncharacterized membrane protein
MDHPRRTLAKCLTWQITGLCVMLTLGWLTTGSLALAGGLALSSTLIGSLTYLLHERIWARIRWGRSAPEETAINT